MTAVEWLIEEYFGSIKNCTPNFRKHIEQAKEMEKQQIIEAYKSAEDKSEFFEYEHRYGREYLTVEQYYNETFKSE